MPVTMQQVIAYLNVDEPKYAEAARLGEDAVPHLLTLVAGADIGLASRAAYLAAMIHSSRSGEVVQIALAHANATVRVAAASALPYLSAAASVPLFEKALRDDDAGVRRLAIEALPQRSTEPLFEVLEHGVRNDAEPGLRQRMHQILSGWRELELSSGMSLPPHGDLLAVFPISDGQLVLHFGVRLNPKGVDVRAFRSQRGVTILSAHIDSAKPHQVVLDIEPLPHLPLVVDSITVATGATDDTGAPGDHRSPRFLHGVHTAMELKVPQMETAFPFRSKLAGFHATLECCTGCNGGIHDRDLVVVNNHTGGGWSGIWVRTAKVIDGPYPRWQRVMFAGGILADEDGALTLVDHGWMQVTKGDEKAHHAPPPLPVRTKDVPAKVTESLLTKSLDGTWVEMRDVEVHSVRAVAPKDTRYSRSLKRVELVVDDGSGPANAYLYQPSSAKVKEGQRLSSLRGFVHAEGTGEYVLLSDKEEDLRF